MRYWIYWNELVQGPFELDELVSLHAFDEDLLVCMEDREDWLPAGRVADLSPSVEVQRSLRNRPMPPPPPPPERASSPQPLQGELFGEPSGQSTLFDMEGDDRKGPYAYRPVTDLPTAPATGPLPVTTPIRFERPSTAVLDRPPVLRYTKPAPSPTPVQSFEVIKPPTPRAYRSPPPVRESPVREPVEEIPETPAVPLDIVPETIPDEPLYTPAPPIEEQRPPARRLAPETFVSNDVQPSEKPFVFPSDLLSSEEKHSPNWLPWVLGVLFMIVALGSLGYWLIDHSSSKSAIAETDKPLLPTPVAHVTAHAPEAVANAGSSAATPSLDGLTSTQPLTVARPAARPHPSVVRKVIRRILSAFRSLFAHHAKPYEAPAAADEGSVSPSELPAETAESSDLVPPSAAPREPATRPVVDATSARASSESGVPATVRPQAPTADSPFHHLASSLQSLFAGRGKPTVTPGSAAQTASQATGTAARPVRANAAPAQGQPSPGDSRAQQIISKVRSFFSSRPKAKAPSGAATNGARLDSNATAASDGEDSLLSPSGTKPSNTARGSAMVSDGNPLLSPGLSSEASNGENSTAADAHPTTTGSLTSGHRVRKHSVGHRAGQTATDEQTTSADDAQGTSVAASPNARHARRKVLPPADSSPEQNGASEGADRSSTKPAAAESLEKVLTPGTDLAAPASSVVPARASAAAQSSAPTGERAASADKTPAEKKSWWRRKSKNTKTQSPMPASGTSTAAAVPSWAVASPIDESASKGAVPLHAAAAAATSLPGLPASVVAAAASPVSPSVADPSARKQPTSPEGSAVVTLDGTMPAPPAPDLWAGKQNEAIAAVMGRRTGGRQTIGDRSALMLREMHERELLHAAETGERLYLPDKMSWSALREAGSAYRVYLTLSALQGNGERTEAKQYQFRIDLATKDLGSDDASTHQDFLDPKTPFIYKHDPKTDDMESLLSGVDSVNKQMVRAIMIRKDRHAKAEAKKINAALGAAQDRLQRALGYFRTQYPEKVLQNLAKAYNFVKALTNG